MRAQSFFAGLVVAAAIVGFFAADHLGASDRICSRGYAASQRPDKETWLYLKQEVMRRDGAKMGCIGVSGGGLFNACELKDFELDHIVPLCLGGTNAVSNLQLQHWSDAKYKDSLERQVCRAYCAGKVRGDLPAAQHFFASGDWRYPERLGELLK